jgi:hypothetical protein
MVVSGDPSQDVELLGDVENIGIVIRDSVRAK